MKNLKKMMAMLLSLILMMGMSVTSLAATNDGSIVIRNTTIGETYKAYKIFDLTYTEPAGKDTSTTPAMVTTPVSYKYTRTDKASDGSYPATSTDNLFNYLSDAASPFILEATTTPGVYNVLFNDKYNKDTTTTPTTYTPPTDAQIIEFISKKTGNNTRPDIEGKLLATNWITPSTGIDATSKKATGNEVSFTSMDYGYYYITSSLGSVVTVDSTLKDVTVIDKNQGPNWNGKGKAIIVDDPVCGKKNGDKNSDGTTHKHDDSCYETTTHSASYGDVVDFKVSVDATAFAAPVKTTVPATPANGTAESQIVTYYHVKDTLDAGFAAAKDIEVKIYTTVDNDKDGVFDVVTLDDETSAKKKTYAPDTYTVVRTSDSSAGTNTFELRIPVVEASARHDDASDTSKITGYDYLTPYGANYKIEVTYKAVVEDDAVIAGTGNKNKAQFTYETKAFDPDTPPTDKPPVPGNGIYETSNKKETTTYVFALGIEKVNAKAEHLKGAEFSLSLKEANTSGGYTYTELYGIKLSDGVYKYVRVDASGYLINNDGDYVDSSGNVVKAANKVSAASVNAVKQFKTDDREKIADPSNSTQQIANPAFATLVIKGLEANTYSFREKVAPSGYNVLINYIDVTPTVTDVSKYTESVTTYYDATGNVTSTKTNTSTTVTYAAKVVPVVVINKQGIELPSTGGLGTRTIYMLGACLALSAYLLLYTRKRMAI